jgi:hypothetical protein
MLNRPKPSAKNEQGEYANFESALRKVLSVSHSEMQERLKDQGKRKTKRASASRASDDKH